MTATTVALLALAAFLVGFSKTSIGGIASIAIAIFASVRRPQPPNNRVGRAFDEVVERPESLSCHATQ